MRLHALSCAAALLLSIGAASPLAALAADADHGAAHGAAPGSAMMAEMTTGEVRRIDAPNGRLTIRHAEIKHLDMPGMTMVFKAGDGVSLDGLKPGDAIRFKVEQVGSNLVVTELVKAP